MKLGELQLVENDVIPLISHYPTDTELVYNARERGWGTGQLPACMWVVAAVVPSNEGGRKGREQQRVVCVCVC